MQELIVEANYESLHKVINFVDEELVRSRCTPQLQGNIHLAVEEIFTNIAKYAYHPASGRVSVSIAVADEVLIRFEDTGKPYNPMEHPEPDLDKPLMEREIGGLGVFLVKKMMDKIDYIRLDNKNVLTMAKKVNSS